MLVMLTGLFAFSANAQFTINQSPNPADLRFVNGQDTVIIDTTGTDFSSSTVFYLHYDLTLDADKVIGSSSDTAIVFNWEYLDGFTESYYVTSAVDFGSNQEIEFDPGDINLGGTQDYVTGGVSYYTNTYEMDEVGFRRLTTPEIPELNTSDDASLFVGMYLADVVGTEDSLLVEYSTNGTDWTVMEDVLDSAYFNNQYADEHLGDGYTTIEFELPVNAKTATTSFRIRQGVRSDYVADEDEWGVDADNFYVSIGSESIGTPVFVNNYDVDLPTTTVADIEDEDGNSNFTYYPGDSINVLATFTGYEDQVSEYDFTAIFRYSGQSFRLEAEDISNIISSDNGDGSFDYDFTVSGFLPVDVEFDETWNVTIEAYSGSSPTLGNDIDLETDAVYVGYSADFDDDGDRMLTSPELKIESVTNASVFVDLVKTSTGLSPSGTEIALEYSTDGFESFTQIGDAISLNADLSERDTFDVSSISALITSTTQFRLRQLSNNGSELDTWDVDEFSFYAAGTLLGDGDPVDYQGTTIDIDAPVIVLDAVDVPDDLIYPGDEIELTYNITEGQFVAGTMLTAILEGTDFEYMIGNSEDIAPGDDQDHTITVTVPPIIGGTYSVKLATNPESNTIDFPVFDTEVTITSIDSDNGVFDGTVDVIYPGDVVTANYEISGSLGTGAELFFEVWDQGDETTTDDDEWTILNSATGADINGTISGTLPTDINYDDPSNPKVRIRVGNGLLANSSDVLVEDLSGNNINYFIGTAEGFSGYIFDVFDEELIEGNDPTDIDKLIGSGERSATTIPFEMPFGGGVYVGLNGISYDFDQEVEIQASSDGTTWETLQILEYTGTGTFFSDFFLPISADSWGDETRFRIIYNEDGAAGEFENEIELYYMYVVANESVTANTSEFDINGQFRRPRVSLEVLDSYDFVVGESFEVEYTTEGTFPANTEFALLFEGSGVDGDNIAVVGTSADEGSGTFSATAPLFAFTEMGDGVDLYDEIVVIAYDATDGDYVPNEEIDIEEEEQWLLIEGGDGEGGFDDFDFSDDGNRSLLTQAFDLSGSSSVTLEFDFNPYGVDVTDNVNTIPFLQTSTDDGESFQVLAVDETSLVSDGALYENKTYSVELPSSVLTSATHFRWYQALNLGDGENGWSIDNVKLIMSNGNEISTFYLRENDEESITLSHPDEDGYDFAQVDPTDAVFNGEDVDLSFTKTFETSDDFPTGTTLEFLLYDPGAGDYVTDPETNAPLRIAMASAAGTFTGSIPFYVTEGSYDVYLVASRTDGPDGDYYYVGDEDGGVDVGDLDIFLRAVRTTLDYPDNDVLYAGSNVTFNITVENDATNDAGTSGLYATLVAENFSGGDDLVLAVQEGVDPITLDLPPYLRSNYNFEVRLSENAGLGEVGDILGDSDLLNLEDDPMNFINQEQLSDEGAIYTPDFPDENLTDGNIEFRFDYVSNGNTVYLDYKYTGGWVTWQNLGSYSRTNEFRSFNFGTICCDNTVQFRLRVNGGGDGAELAMRDVNYGNVVAEDEELSPNDYIRPGVLEFANDFGRGLITTREFEMGELSGSTLISFDLTFDELAEDITADQFLIFEYSTDGGSTFDEISSFPDTEEEDNTLDDDNFLFEVTDDMKNNASIFRFRQEERNDIEVEIENFSFLAGQSLPFEYISDNRTIAPQVLLVTGISTDETCLEDEITLSYEVRGSFGAENVVTVTYDEIDGNAGGEIDFEEFNLVSGTGDLPAFTLPSEVFNEGESNKHLRFKLNYDDETYEEEFEISYSSSSEPLSEGSIEVIAPVDLTASISLVSGDLVCDPDNLIVSIDDPQDYFTYQVIDLADGSNVGDPFTYDPEEGETEIDLGALTANIDLGLSVTASSSTGNTSCGAITSTEVLEVEILQNYELYLYNDNKSDYDIVSTGKTITICEDEFTELSVRRLFENGSTSSASNAQIEWFRNDLNTPLEDVQFLDDDQINQTGTYFARVTDGVCSYVTESIDITVIPSADKPTITVASGNLAGCEEDDPVVLEAPTGFAYYQWSTPDGTKTKRVINAEWDGSYTVQVSNRPFGSAGNCESPASNAVYVERYNLSQFGISLTSSITGGDVISEGDVIDACETETIYFFDETSWTANAGTIEIIRDGVSDGFTTSSFITLEESGVYSFNWINDDAPIDAPSCTASSVEFTLNILEIPDPVTITTTDALAFCEGEGSVTITAPAGFAQYRWLDNGSVIDSNADGFGNTNNSITVDYAGEFSVQVSNEADGTGCFSNRSNEIEVNVRQYAFDAVSVNQIGTLCGPGTARYEITGTVDDYNYQIYNNETDAPVGNAFRGNNNNASIFVDIDVTEQTDFYVISSYASGEGCPSPEPSTTFTVSFYNVELELEGNTINAVTSGGFGWDEIEWFRNGVRLQSRSGDDEITITDAAEYSAEVTFNDGECVIVTNSVTIESTQIQTFFGELEASTYPNPSSDYINVDMKGGDLGSYSVSIASLSGQVMLAEKFEKTEEEDALTVDIRSLDKGIYTLIISKGNTLQSFRIVKK